MQKRNDKRNSSESFLAYNYKKCWEFLREIRWYFFASLAIFVFFFLVGFAYPMFFREEIIDILSNLGSSIEGKDTASIITFIFFNNTQASFFAFASGIVIAIFPVLVLIFNGYLLGFVGNAVVAQEGLGELLKILPHGIFELPAIFFSTAIGIKIGVDMFRKDKGKMLKHNYSEGLRFFISVVIPLLIIAAIIEGVLIALLR